MSSDGEVYVSNIVATNTKQLQLARGLVCGFAGCVAGVLGFGWMGGFIMFACVSLLIGFIMLMAASINASREKPSVSRKSYIPSTWSYFTQGAMPCFMVSDIPFTT